MSGDDGYAIWQAAHKGDRTGLTRLVELGMDVNARDEEGYTAIILAAASGHTDCVNILISFRADVNAQNSDKALLVTALHCAAIGGWPSCAESLVKAGADLSIRDGAGDTALDWAIRENHLEIVELLETAKKQQTSKTCAGDGDESPQSIFDLHAPVSPQRKGMLALKVDLLGSGEGSPSSPRMAVQKVLRHVLFNRSQRYQRAPLLTVHGMESCEDRT